MLRGAINLFAQSPTRRSKPPGQQQLQSEATLLDMGEYAQCPSRPLFPMVLTPQYLGLHSELREDPPSALTTKAATTLRSPSSPEDINEARTNTMQRLPSQQPGELVEEQAEDALPLSVHHLHLYQVLAPSLVARGRLFGSELALGAEWLQLDPPYFSAPGEASSDGMECCPHLCDSCQFLTPPSVFVFVVSCRCHGLAARI